MAITFVNAASALANGTSVSVNKPADIAVGDVLLAHAFAENASAVWTGPEGFTPLNAHTATAISGRSWYKVAAAGDVAAESFAFGSSRSTDLAAQIVAFRGCDPTDPISASGMNSVGTATVNVSISPSVSTEDANEMLVFLLGDRVQATFSGWNISTGMNPAAWYEAVEASNAATSIACAYGRCLAGVAPGTTGSWRCTASASGGFNGACIALRQAHTRIYLPSSGAAPLGTIDPDAAWESQASSFYRAPAVYEKSDTALTDITSEAPNTNNQDMLFAQFVSGTLDSAYEFTAADTVRIIVRCAEENLSVDAKLAYCVRVVSGDGATVRGTLLALSRGATEFATTPTTRTVVVADLTPVSAQEGDRIVVEVGAYLDSPATGYDITLRHGDAAATDDFAFAALTTDLCPWVEITPAVEWTFGPEWTGLSITINDGDAATDDNDVTLTIAALADGVAPDQMCFSDDGVTYGAWENYATSRAYQLPAQDDEDPHTCTVYVKFRVTEGGTDYDSDAVSDSITLQIDWTDLSVYLEVVTLNDGMPVAGVTEVPLTFGGTSSAGDVVQYCYAIDGGAAVAWGTYVPDLSRPYHPMSITVELGTTGEHYVDVYLKDDDDNTLLIGRDDVLITDKTTIDYTRPFGVIPVRMYADSSQVRKMSHDIEAPNLLPVRIPTSAKRRR